MNYLKMLSLATCVAAALTAIAGAGSASADVLCTKTETPCQAANTISEIHAVNVGSIKLTTAFKTLECTGSTLSATVSGDGGAGTPVTLNVTTFTITGCNCTISVLENGTLSITQVAGSDNGTVSSSGALVTMSCSTIIGTVHCIYSTNNTHTGVLTGGHDPILHTEEAETPRHVTSAACAEKAKLDRTYTITNHTNIFMEPS